MADSFYLPNMEEEQRASSTFRRARRLTTRPRPVVPLSPQAFARSGTQPSLSRLRRSDTSAEVSSLLSPSEGGQQRQSSKQCSRQPSKQFSRRPSMQYSEDRPVVDSREALSPTLAMTPILSNQQSRFFFGKRMAEEQFSQNHSKEGLLWKLNADVDPDFELEQWGQGKLSEWANWRRRRFSMTPNFDGDDSHLDLSYISDKQHGRKECGAILYSPWDCEATLVSEVATIYMLSPDADDVECLVDDLFTYEKSLGHNERRFCDEHYTRDLPHEIYPFSIVRRDRSAKGASCLVIGAVSQDERAAWIKALQAALDDCWQGANDSSSRALSKPISPHRSHGQTPKSSHRRNSGGTATSPSSRAQSRRGSMRSNAEYDFLSHRNISEGDISADGQVHLKFLARRTSTKSLVQKTSTASTIAHGEASIDEEPLEEDRPDIAFEWTSSAPTSMMALLLAAKAGRKFKLNRLRALSDALMVEDELRKMYMFRFCQPAAVSAIAELCQAHSFQAEEEIIGEGSTGSSLIYVMRGRIDVFVAGVKAKTLRAGQHIGETFLFDIEDTWHAGLYADVSCTVCALSRNSLLDALEKFPEELAYFEKLRHEYCEARSDLNRVGTLENPCKIFQGLSGGALGAIDKLSVQRLFFPGEVMLEEGGPMDELFILAKGEISKRLTDREVVREKAGWFAPMQSQHFTEETAHCFGELGLLGIQETASASVIAESVCYVRIIYSSVFAKTLEEYDEELGHVSIDEEIDIGRALHDVQMFRKWDCSDEFLDFLSMHLEACIFLPGAKITDEDVRHGRCMYIISQGRAKIFQQGHEVAEVGPGEMIGEISVLGLASNPNSTCIAEEACSAQVLHQCVIVHALELFPHEQRKVLRIAVGISDNSRPFHKGTGDSGETDFALNFVEKLKLKYKGTGDSLLKRSPLLSGFDPAFVDELKEVAQDRLYMPGDVVMEMGRPGDSMFVTVSGTARVHIPPLQELHEESWSFNGQQWGVSPNSEVYPRCDETWPCVGTLTTGDISGERAMLGIVKVRGATIVAETICYMWEVTQEDAIMVIERFPKAKEHFCTIVNQHLDKTIRNCILRLPLFHNFDPKFTTLLSLYCDRDLYFPGQMITREGVKGDKLFIVNIGSAVLEKRGMPVKTYLPGSHFGSTVMLRIDKMYVGTIVAESMCHLVTISANSYHLALGQYPSVEASHMELKSKEKKITEQLCEAAKRTAMRKVLWSRYQWVLAGPTTQTDIVSRVMTAWYRQIQVAREDDERKADEWQRWGERMGRWWQRHLEDQEHLSHQRHLDEILKHNLGRSGTPLFPSVASSNVRFWMGQTPVAVSATPARTCYTSVDGRASVLRSRCSSAATQPSAPVCTRGRVDQSATTPLMKRLEPCNTSASGNASTLASTWFDVGTDSKISPAPRVPTPHCTSIVKSVLWSARAASPCML